MPWLATDDVRSGLQIPFAPTPNVAMGMGHANAVVPDGKPGSLDFRNRGRHPELRFAIRFSNSQDTVVAENSKTRVEAASQL